MKKLILLVMLIFVANAAFAHSDWIFTSKSGVVKTEITTGFNYEDINKVEITGKLINILSDELKNNTEIHVSVRHTYTSPDFKAKYCISYESGKIIINGYCYRVAPLDLVKLAEYAIRKKKNLKNMQKEETFDIPYRTQTSLSVGDSAIAEVLNRQTSDTVAKVLKNKVYRPVKKGESSSFTYYFQDNRYCIVGSEYNYSNQKFEEVVLAEYDDFFQFSVLLSENILLFDNDSSFVFYASKAQPFHPRNRISKRHIFDNLNEWSRPYNVSYMGRDRICITMYYQPTKRFKTYFDETEAGWTATGRENNMIYLADNDYLIEDADDILDAIAIERINQP